MVAEPALMGGNKRHTPEPPTRRLGCSGRTSGSWLHRRRKSPSVEDTRALGLHARIAQPEMWFGYGYRTGHPISSDLVNRWRAAVCGYSGGAAGQRLQARKGGWGQVEPGWRSRTAALLQLPSGGVRVDAPFALALRFPHWSEHGECGAGAGSAWPAPFDPECVSSKNSISVF